MRMIKITKVSENTAWNKQCTIKLHIYKCQHLVWKELKNFLHFYFKSMYFFFSPPLCFELFKGRDCMFTAPSRYSINICQMKEWICQWNSDIFYKFLLTSDLVPFLTKELLGNFLVQVHCLGPGQLPGSLVCLVLLFPCPPFSWRGLFCWARWLPHKGTWVVEYQAKTGSRFFQPSVQSEGCPLMYSQGSRRWEEGMNTSLWVRPRQCLEEDGFKLGSRKQSFCSLSPHGILRQIDEIECYPSAIYSKEKFVGSILLYFIMRHEFSARHCFTQGHRKPCSLRAHLLMQDRH